MSFGKAFGDNVKIYKKTGATNDIGEPIDQISLEFESDVSRVLDMSAKEKMDVFGTSDIQAIKVLYTSDENIDVSDIAETNGQFGIVKSVQKRRLRNNFVWLTLMIEVKKLDYEIVV